MTSAATPASRRGAADIVVICVSDTPDVEAVLFGPDGVVEGAREGTLVIDCSTIAPSGELGLRRAPRASAASRMVDAPVSGGSEGAQKATLTIFVGGDAADVERARPVLDAHGQDDHPRRADRRRPGGQGRQPGHPGRHLPRRRRGHRPCDQGRARCRAGRRGARRRRRPELGPRQPQRPDDRQRLPARVQGRAPPQGPRHRPRPRRRSSGAALPVSALAAQLETGLIAGATRDDDMSALARAIRALSGLDD